MEENKDTVKKVPKKRGRKPKGGKIIDVVESNAGVVVPKPNIILHLKCFVSNLESNKMFFPLEYKPDVEPIESYQFTNSKNYHFNFVSSDIEETHNSKDSEYSIEKMKNEKKYTECKESEGKEIWKKLKLLANKMHNNDVSEKRSACFWCTCDFENPPIFIPKLELNSSYNCYGCFCSPECATSHLFKEDIDSSIKFERYHMMNHVYSKIYNYEKNIKPAPDPYYTLDKFYGNLSIEEYRSLMKKDRILFVVDKPLVRIMPELHLENDELNFDNNLTQTSKYKVKKKNVKTKKDIMSKTFNFAG